MIVKVLTPFRDKYSNVLYNAGDSFEAGQERIDEIKSVNPDLISVEEGSEAPVKTTRRGRRCS